VFALVDCNNFYASCERLFRPDLRETPIVVLSNNDGCVVARSAESKNLGIKMAVPYFHIKELIEREKVEVFSSNYTLYGDISSRVMSTLEHMAPRVEVYSIDEAFLDLTGLSHISDLTEFGMTVKQRVYRDNGIHVCVGIASTKTLAKLANYAAKKYPKTDGVLDLSNPTWRKRLLSITPASEVWGVGRRISKQLEAMNIVTALDLANASTSTIRKRFSVVLERTIRELNGTPCIEFEDAPASKKQIVCSRTFGQRVTEYEDMRAAVCKHAERAAEKLRNECLTAKQLTVFVRTNPFNSTEPYYANSGNYILATPSTDTREFVTGAVSVLDKIWRIGFRYMKAGVMLSDFYAPGTFQPSLFDSPTRTNTSESLMNTLDHINSSGIGQISFAGRLRSERWKMQRNRLSPRYTTSWKDLPVVKTS